MADTDVPYLIDQMREVMDQLPGISEKKMFGALFWMLNGNMLCSVSRHGFMFRVGARREKEALERPGAMPMHITKRPMPGFIHVEVEGALEIGLQDWVAYTAEFVGAMPPKEKV